MRIVLNKAEGKFVLINFSFGEVVLNFLSSSVKIQLCLITCANFMLAKVQCRHFNLIHWTIDFFLYLSINQSPSLAYNERTKLVLARKLHCLINLWLGFIHLCRHSQNVTHLGHIALHNALNLKPPWKMPWLTQQQPNFLRLFFKKELLGFFFLSKNTPFFCFVFFKGQHMMSKLM